MLAMVFATAFVKLERRSPVKEFNKNFHDPPLEALLLGKPDAFSESVRWTDRFNESFQQTDSVINFFTHKEKIKLMCLIMSPK